jgi:hypothetical protein
MSDSIAYCGQQLLGVSITIAIVQILVVGGRLYTRQMQKVAYGIDDYLIIPALVRTSESTRSILVVHQYAKCFTQMASLGQSAVYIYRMLGT